VVHRRAQIPQRKAGDFGLNEGEADMKPDWHTLWKDNKNLVFFIVMIVVFKSSLADWNSVPTGSMKPTIVEGDRILVNKLAYGLNVPLTRIRLMSWGDPVRGDIVVFDSVVEKTRLVKRVIGLPGDTIAMQDNQLFINGSLLNYSELGTDGAYLQAMEHLGDTPHAMQVGADTPSPAGSFGPVTVPAGNLLVLGDNRDNSKDSRYIGFVPRREIIGRARYVVLSLDYDNYHLPRTHRMFQALDVPANPAD
jgi:signal peptidase I